jgi:uncharacterized protein (TIRG00374 family)
VLKTRRFWIGVVFSAALLSLFFVQVDLSETADTLRSANYIWFIPAIAIYFVAVLFRSLRWHFFLRPLKPISPWRLYPVVVIGYMANNLLPMRLGEFVRSFFLSEREGISKSATLATIILERVFDGVGLLIIALIVWPLLPVPDVLRDFTEDSGFPLNLLLFLVIAPFAIVLGIFAAVALSPRFGRGIVRVILVVVPGALKHPAESIMQAFVDGLASLRNPRRILAALLLTFPVWIAEGSMYYLISLGFDIDQPFHAMMFTTSTSNLATSLPSSAGGVGPFEYATRVTLEGLGVAGEIAAAFAIALHVALLAPVTMLGLLFMWTQNLSLKQAVETRFVDSPEDPGFVDRVQP